jgi:hypothetical protein
VTAIASEPQSTLEQRSPTPSAPATSRDLIAEAEGRIRNGALDRSAILQLVAEYTCAVLGATGAAIALRDGDDIVCYANSGNPVPPLGGVVPTDFGLTGECLRKRQIQCCDDTYDDPRVDRDSCRRLGVRSVVLIPLIEQDSVAGILEALSPNPQAFANHPSSTFERLARLLNARTSCDTAGPSSGGMAAARRRVAAVEDLWGRTVAAPAPRSWKTHVWTGVLSLIVAASWTVWKFRPWSESGPHAAAPEYSHTAVPNSLSVLDSPAFKDLREQATAGQVDSQFLLGLKYLAGDDVPKNESEGVRWVTSAAENGNTAAESLLGALYWAGRGVEKDYVKAYTWSAIAADAGNSDSRDRLRMVAQLMSPQDITSAQVRANAWLAQHRPSSHRRTTPAVSQTNKR